MEVRALREQERFTTKDGSTITSLLDASNAPVVGQSLAEARLGAGQATQRHYHRESEEIYYILSGGGEMEVGGEVRDVSEGDAILIPAGEWHRIAATMDSVFLCCCAPPYSDGDTYFE